MATNHVSKSDQNKSPVSVIHTCRSWSGVNGTMDQWINGTWGGKVVVWDKIIWGHIFKSPPSFIKNILNVNTTLPVSPVTTMPSHLLSRATSLPCMYRWVLQNRYMAPQCRFIAIWPIVKIFFEQLQITNFCCAKKKKCKTSWPFRSIGPFLPCHPVPVWRWPSTRPVCRRVVPWSFRFLSDFSPLFITFGRDVILFVIFFSFTFTFPEIKQHV